MKNLHLVIVTAGIAAASCVAPADELRFVFDGIVTATGGGITPPVSIGDQVVYWHVFDPEQTDAEPGEGYGRYPDAIRASRITFENGFSLQIDFGDIMILDNAALGDAYRVEALHPIAYISLQLADFESDQFETDALPVTLDFDDFEMHQLNMQFEVGPTFWSADADITGFRAEPVCRCDLDHDNGVDVIDLLIYLERWFAEDPSADIDGTTGVSASDLLAYLACWFPSAGGSPCP